MAYMVPIQFVRFPSFEKSSAGLFNEADVFELELALLVDPQAGDLIPGANGLHSQLSNLVRKELP